MADIKRLHYFNHQFLVEADFTDAQQYHLALRRRHNAALHGYGVADGLAVTRTGDREITVQPGMAIDRDGRELVLLDSRIISLSDTVAFPAGATIQVTIAYHEEESDPGTATGVTGNTRITERPDVHAVTTAPPGDGSLIHLAQFALTSGGNVPGNLGDTFTDGRQLATAVLAPASVATAELADGAVTSAKLADAAVTEAKLANGTVTTAKLADNAVTGAKLADNAVDAAKIVDGSVGTIEIANSAVTDVKLANGAVINAKLAANSVDASKIVAGSVGSNELANAGVTNAKLADNSVDAAKIADGSIGTNEIASSAVTDVKLANGAVVNAKLAANSVDASKIVAGSIGSNELANAGVTNAKLADNSVDAAKIADGSIGTNEIANAGVTSAKLAANSVDATKIVDGSIGTAEIADQAITGAKLASSLQINGLVGIGVPPGFPLDVNGRMRIRQTATGANTAGMWLSGYYQSEFDAAFVGLQDRNSVGFWSSVGNPGWRLIVSLDSGALTVTGNAFKPGGGAWGTSSDQRLKQDIEPLPDALERLLQLKPISFAWKEPEKQGNLTGPQMGFLAQDVESVFPEWVGVDPQGYKTLTIRGFEALAVEALKRLKGENDRLKETLTQMQQRIDALEQRRPASKKTDSTPSDR